MVLHCILWCWKGKERNWKTFKEEKLFGCKTNISSTIFSLLRDCFCMRVMSFQYTLCGQPQTLGSGWFAVFSCIGIGTVLFSLTSNWEFVV